MQGRVVLGVLKMVNLHLEHTAPELLVVMENNTTLIIITTTGVAVVGVEHIGEIKAVAQMVRLPYRVMVD